MGRLKVEKETFVAALGHLTRCPEHQRAARSNSVLQSMIVIQELSVQYGRTRLAEDIESGRVPVEVVRIPVHDPKVAN